LPSIFCIFEPGRPAASSLAQGVGHIFTIPVSSNSFFRFPLRLVCPPLAQAAVGVGHILFPVACSAATCVAKLH
jgi:hypothetical protein